MTKHTPGEWNILWDEAIKVRDSAGFGTIATLGHLTKPHEGPRRDFDEVRANARLIAAAPGLLSALGNLIYAAALYVERDPSNMTLAVAVDDARAAIAKVQP
jgi:hypothetical protein